MAVLIPFSSHQRESSITSGLSQMAFPAYGASSDTSPMAFVAACAISPSHCDTAGVSVTGLSTSRASGLMVEAMPSAIR